MKYIFLVILILIFYKTEITKCPTRATSNTSYLIDQVHTKYGEKIFQSGITDCGMSDHQHFVQEK